jgi:hypothetical protein
VSLLITFIYAFFGIAILAFCIDLIQEEILLKFASTRNLFANKVKVSRNVILNQKEKNVMIQNQQEYEIVTDSKTDIRLSNYDAISSPSPSTPYSRRERVASNSKMPPVNEIY